MSQHEKRCMGCMNPLPEGRQQCGICGYPVDRQNLENFLQTNSIVSERYIVGKLMSYNGDAAEYIGYDNVLNIVIRIREFYPDTLSERNTDSSLRIISGCEPTYNDLLEQFRVHARALARMRELTNIEAIYDIFDEGNTAYTVAEYVEGITLESRLKSIVGLMTWEDARPLFMPLITAVSSLHAAGIYHYGISPQNIIVSSKDGKLHLQGFSMSQARQVGGDLTPNLISGYSAPEQYSFGEDLSEYTDVYGLGATIFRTITGNPMPDGAHRASDSNDLFVPSEVAQTLPKHVAMALFQALQVNPGKRIQTVLDFRDQLATAPAVSALLEDEEPYEIEEEIEEVPDAKSKRVKTSVIVVLVAIVIMFIFFGTLLYVMYGDRLFGPKESDASLDPSRIVTTTTKKKTTKDTKNKEQMYKVPNIIGKSVYDYPTTFGNGKFSLDPTWVYDDKVPEGTILEQKLADKEAPYEAKIEVVASLGPSELTVPNNLKGQNAKLVEMLLQAMGFKTEILERTSDVDKGLVDEVQFQGEKKPRGAKVIIYVSDTPTTTTTQSTKATTTQTTEDDYTNDDSNTNKNAYNDQINE